MKKGDSIFGPQCISISHMSTTNLHGNIRKEPNYEFQLSYMQTEQDLLLHKNNVVYIRNSSVRDLSKTHS